jgi:4a-hydroxytetrahydrobiopterin dehydratase
MAVLSEEEVRGQVGDWEVAGDSISRVFERSDFKGAIAFVMGVAFEAEAANHHPDLDIRYNKVTVTLSTHSEGGVTSKDVDMAKAIDSLAG